jgi:hypothetical protein
MRTTRGVLALLLGIASFGAIAYAASPRGSGPGSAPTKERSQGATSLPKPKLTMHPDKVSPSGRAKFGFTARGRDPRFQCRLDSRSWTACKSPFVVNRLTVGLHGFSVRTVAARGASGKVTRFRWRVLEPKDFSIVPQLAGLAALYPGAPAQALPLLLSNPNPVPIFVTSLQVKATADPAGCSSADNLILSGSSASDAAPIKLPAGGSLSLPAPGTAAPTIQLRDLPVNQDACQRAQFPLAFFGRARG